MLPEGLPVEEPVLGVLGDFVLGEVELDEPLPVEPDELLPLPMPDELPELLLEPAAPDLLKCASHSEREIWPSLLVSTDEKLGVLLELDELGELDEPPAALDGELLDELPLVADGEDEDELPDLALSAATASVERAKSAAAVVTVTDLSIAKLLWVGGKPPTRRKRRAA